MKKDNIKNISNIKISYECFKELKHMAIDEDITMQEVVASLLEKITLKKINKPTKLNEVS